MRLSALLFLLFLPQGAHAQGAATLVADSVSVTADKQLVANGNVEVLYGDTRLTATQIIYDSESDQLRVVGPIIIRLADDTIVTAQSAEMDPLLENGILQGARIVLDQQLQLAANQINRIDGRYSQLYRTVATSCKVCDGRAPLWSIRAERVIHDNEAQQLYFENATLRIRDVPVLWLPMMRLPDPNLDRATGFLIPEQRNTNLLGTGLKIPYFIRLGDHRDVTVTPYISPETTTLELIYRQAFRNGDTTMKGAISDDTLDSSTRSYAFVAGSFDLANDYKLRFDIESVSDTAYLLDYDYSDKDRLDSAIDLTRVTDTSLTQAALTYYQTLRDDESNASLPPLIADARYETRVYPGFGGTLKYGTSIDSAYRYSTTNGDAGRDVARIGGFGTWQNDWAASNGVLSQISAGLRTDIYAVNDDDSYSEMRTRLVPYVQTVLRFPLAKTTGSGAAHLIEPTISLSWADSYGAKNPNEDSTRSEFDRGNLFSISRFAGEDAFETGLQGAVGATWTRIGAEGTATTFAMGRVLHTENQADFTRSSGLDGLRSDWLVAGQVATLDGFIFDVRALVDSTDGVTVIDSRAAWQNDAVALSAAYIWQTADTDENRDSDVSEWTLDTDIVLNDVWSISLSGRYDVVEDSPVKAGIGVGWQNECVNINVSASRRYTSSTTVDPTTTFGISGSLTGFSAGRSGNALAASCRN